jgi:coenzyme F420-0:L-glutamate ligase/coenzyme F420-1:gamma-L-glutamate ligase
MTRKPHGSTLPPTLSAEAYFCAGAPDSSEFWDSLDRLVAEKRLVIERPQGTCHPGYPDMVYPLDYGYLQGTLTADGGGIDVWRGSQDLPFLDAVVLTIDPGKNDAEIKLLLGCSEAEKQVVLDFFGHALRGAQLVRRGGFYAWISGRRSVRRFLSRPVSQQVLERILEAATWAPSAHNRQPWRFAVLHSLQAKTALAQAMGVELERDLLADGLQAEKASMQVARSHRRIEKAPLGILLCLDSASIDPIAKRVAERPPDARRQQAEWIMGVQGVAMAAENMLLAAHAEGLGGVWLCAPLFAPESVRQALGLPDNWQPQGLMLIGYQAQHQPVPVRYSLAEVTRVF